MPLSHLVKEFNLDAESIERDRKMSAGLGRAHRHAAVGIENDESRRFVHLMASATEYRRAGAHSILLSDRVTSAQMFQQAGRAYAELRRPYALMMFLCVEDLEQVVARARDFGAADKIERTQLAYLLLTAAGSGETPDDPERLHAIRARLAGAEASPIGLLGLPVGAYLDLAEALQHQIAPGRTMPHEPQASLREAVLPFLIAYSTTVRRCMQNEHHWRLMAFPFHPTEPDVLSVLFCVEAALRKRQQGSLLNFLATKGDDGSLTPVLPLFPVATTLLYNAIQERFAAELPSKLDEERMLKTIRAAVDVARLAGRQLNENEITELVRTALSDQGLVVDEHEIRRLVKGLSLHGPRSTYSEAENRKWLRNFLAEELKKKGLDPEKFLGDVLL